MKITANLKEDATRFALDDQKVKDLECELKKARALVNKIQMQLTEASAAREKTRQTLLVSANRSGLSSPFVMAVEGAESSIMVSIDHHDGRWEPRTLMLLS